MSKVTFIGAGNMGGALVSAVSRLQQHDVYVLEPNEARCREVCAAYGCTAATTADLADSDVVFLGVKPQVFAATVAALPLDTRPLYVSMAAGVAIAKLETMLPAAARIVRIMPNTSVGVGEGMVLYCPNAKADAQDEALFVSLLAKAGKVDKLDEKLIDAASAVSGCGPAFVYMFIEALADGAVQCGLPRDKALLYAEQTMVGAATMAMQSAKHPEQLKDEVCSPAGSTIEGVHALEDGGLRAACINAVVAAYRRTKELGK